MSPCASYPLGLAPFDRLKGNVSRIGRKRQEPRFALASYAANLNDSSGSTVKSAWTFSFSSLWYPCKRDVS